MKVERQVSTGVQEAGLPQCISSPFCSPFRFFQGRQTSQVPERAQLALYLRPSHLLGGMSSAPPNLT